MTKDTTKILLKEINPNMAYRKYIVLVPSLALGSMFALSPALARIQEAFPYVPNNNIQMIIAIPSLIAFPFIIFSGYLTSVFTKRTLILVSLILMLFGGIFPLYSHKSLLQLITNSIVYGIGFGILAPISTALIKEYCGKNEQNRMLGYQSAVVGLGGIIFGLSGGVLASFVWWYAYATYFLLVPVILTSLLIPYGTVNAYTKYKNIFNTSLLFYLVQGLFSSVCFYIFNTNIALVIESHYLGDASTAGTITALFSGTSVFGGLLAGKIMNRFRQYTLVFIFFVAAIGLFIISNSSNLSQLIFGTFILGLVFAARMPSGYMLSTTSVPEDLTTLAISYFCAFSILGQFFSPNIINRASNFLGGSLKSRFTTGIIILIALNFATLIKEYFDYTKTL